MKFRILHENKTRMRIHLLAQRLDYEQAEIFLYYLQSKSFVKRAKIYDRNSDAVIEYNGTRDEVIRMVQQFSFEDNDVPTDLIDVTGRQMSHEFQEKLVNRIVFHYARKLILPYPIRLAYNIYKTLGYIKEAIKSLSKGKLEVSVLDATAITVSMLRGDIDTAGSTMFMLGIGELLEEWTHKKSVSDLAHMMSLNVGQVWLVTGDTQVQVPVGQIKKGDEIVVSMGSVIPFDGRVKSGEAMINQASLTGESVAVRRTKGKTVFAGTTVEEGEIVIKVTSAGGSSRYEKIVSMIEDTEKLKSAVESQASHLADRLVPFCLGGTILTYLLTRNVTKALAVLMVDYSCALNLAMPVTVLSAIREAGEHHITVKGGKFLEAVAEADTIVFDKTGTLTKAEPTVARIVPFNGKDEDELLRIAACLEEHFPHSMAKAVVKAAQDKKLDHEEMHSKVEYIVAHGIASSIDNERVVIGSYHFVFEDEKCKIPRGKKAIFDALPEEYSHLYLAIDGKLNAVICIEDPLRQEAPSVVKTLKDLGLKVVMMTGDSDKTANAIAEKLRLDEYYSEVLPEDKANFVAKEKSKGRKVIMIGDGINDSPALSAADVGIAISDGAELAREIADITIAADDLNEIIVLRKLSTALMRRIQSNYRKIIGFNTGLIGLGIAGIIQPTTSSFLHNGSTLIIGMSSMSNLLE